MFSSNVTNNIGPPSLRLLSFPEPNGSLTQKSQNLALCFNRVP